MKTKMILFISGCFFLVFVQNITGQEMDNQSIAEYIWPSDTVVAQKLRQWKDWKFGLIIHWGPYSEWGVVESWSLCPEDEPWCERKGPFSDDYNAYKFDYENIYSSFYPDQFNPDGWAAAAKNAGIRYVVFTTKHHDGFCMFDSKQTEYRITSAESRFSSHPKSDVTKAVFDAFRSEGLAIGAYFSKPDWHHKDYWWPRFPPKDRNVNYDPEKYPEKWERFKQFTFSQIRELMENYGKVDILWLDGGWVRPANSLTAETLPWIGKYGWIQDINMQSIAAMARKNQPGILIVDRTVHGEFENYRTPEQQIPVDVPAYPWESCITLGDSWYSTGPDENYKSVEWVIHTLVKIVARGGNLLLGIGPDKTGDFVPEVYKRLKQVGEWMQINGKAIYETKPMFPYNIDSWYFTQSNDGKKWYAIHLNNQQITELNELTLPEGLVKKGISAFCMDTKEKVKIEEKSGRQYIKITKGMHSSSHSSQALVFEFSQ